MVTFTILALAALLALAWWVRRRVVRSAGRKRLDLQRAEAARLRAEQDRLDCLELERSLSSGPRPSSQRVGGGTAAS